MDILDLPAKLDDLNARGHKGYKTRVSKTYASRDRKSVMDDLFEKYHDDVKMRRIDTAEAEIYLSGKTYHVLIDMDKDGGMSYSIAEVI